MLGHVREVAPLTLRLVVSLLSITLTSLNTLNQWFVMIMKHKDTSKNKYIIIALVEILVLPLGKKQIRTR